MMGALVESIFGEVEAAHIAFARSSKTKHLQGMFQLQHIIAGIVVTNTDIPSGVGEHHHQSLQDGL